eukprot:CAMPEP_0168623548 /NCGR_PEP_ID=MMETSP0449_2-20121227/8890_1 /TAXON_ID=1082188 /ORGANISM="Strombidium rassoulzadegani, Strain ras09" /LENGTH=69 /DNA_ID=CAMNT_0008664949 /DNA_START=53 /DNA_END=262 /DNA_ORIENTATION=+
MSEIVLECDMMCGGCEAAVTRVIKKMEGVEDFTVDHTTKRVVIKGTGLDPKVVEEKIAKTGKATKLISS